jgi:nucleoside-diphosphate-sugar epimerase
MTKALIGYSGFVGSTLLKQGPFENLYRSTNIADIEGKTFDTVICAGAPAQKWLANREPAADRQKIDGLISHLSKVTCKTFVLISTVDVFGTPIGVDENVEVNEEGLHAYGLHRRLLEKFVERHFSRRLIVRLPGLVGPGLRKNAIFDLLNDNNLDTIDSRAKFQFYPMVNLGFDIQTALQADLNLLHLAAEPISIARIAKEGFGRDFDNCGAGKPALYDMRSRHTSIFGANGPYQYSARDQIQAVRSYAQSESPFLEGMA